MHQISSTLDELTCPVCETRSASKAGIRDHIQRLHTSNQYKVANEPSSYDWLYKRTSLISHAYTLNLTATKVMRGDKFSCLQNWTAPQLAHNLAYHVTDRTAMPSEDELKKMPRADLISRTFMWHYIRGTEQDVMKNTMTVREQIEANYEWNLDQVLPNSTSGGSKLANFMGLLKEKRVYGLLFLRMFLTTCIEDEVRIRLYAAQTGTGHWIGSGTRQVDYILSWQRHSISRGLTIDEDTTDATQRAIAHIQTSFQMSKKEIKTKSISVHYSGKFGLVECPRTGRGFELKSHFKQLFEFGDEQPACIAILCHGIEAISTSYWELCLLGDYLHYKLPRTTILLLFKEEEGRLKRSELWEKAVKLTWTKYLSNKVVYRICPLLLECLIARIRLPNDMSLNLAPPGLKVNVDLVMERLQKGFFARCRDPVLRKGRNEFDREGS